MKTASTLAFCFAQTAEEIQLLEAKEREETERRERARMKVKLQQQRMESLADDEWLKQEEKNIELPRSPLVSTIWRSESTLSPSKKNQHVVIAMIMIL